jgi:hypothetical protein
LHRREARTAEGKTDHLANVRVVVGDEYLSHSEPESITGPVEDRAVARVLHIFPQH